MKKHMADATSKGGTTLTSLSNGMTNARRRIIHLRTGAVLVGIAVILAFGADSLAGEPPYSGAGHLSASSDWTAFFVTAAILLLPMLALLALAFASLQGAKRALPESSAAPERPGRALRLLGRAVGSLVACLVVGFVLGGLGGLLNVGCPQVQNNSADATCVAGTAALVADSLIGLIGSIALLLAMRGLRRHLIDETLQGHAFPTMKPWLQAYVMIYADRRRALSQKGKERLALRIRAPLREAVPELVERKGPLGALDELADKLL